MRIDRNRSNVGRLAAAGLLVAGFLLAIQTGFAAQRSQKNKDKDKDKDQEISQTGAQCARLRDLLIFVLIFIFVLL